MLTHHIEVIVKHATSLPLSFVRLSIHLAVYIYITIHLFLSDQSIQQFYQLSIHAFNTYMHTPDTHAPINRQTHASHVHIHAPTRSYTNVYART